MRLTTTAGLMGIAAVGMLVQVSKAVVRKIKIFTQHRARPKPVWPRLRTAQVVVPHMPIGAVFLAAGVAIAIAPSVAHADIVFDFESFAGNDDHTAGDYAALTVESGGVFAVITRTSGERFTIWDSQNIQMPSDWGTKHISPAFNLTEDDYMLMSFSEPLSSVTIEFGDFGQDQDLAEIFAYDQLHGAGNLIGYSSGDMGDSDIRRDAATALTVNASQDQEIWSVRFRGGIDPFYQSTFIDNIRVNLVPTPGTLAALGLSLAVCSHRLRRPSLTRPANRSR